MLSIYILSLNYDFFSFLVFWSHFYVSFMHFSCKIQRLWKCTKRSWKALKWMQSVSQGSESVIRCSECQSRCSELHSRCSEAQNHCSKEPQDQSESWATRVYSLQWKSLFVVANLCNPDSLEHETLGYTRGSSSHFEGGGERKQPKTIFRERNT